MTTAAGSGTPDHVLWLTETYPPSRGGMAQSCDRIVRGLRRRGVTVDVLHFTPRPSGRPWVVEQQAGGRYLACPIEDDPAHALNRAWSTLQAQPAPVTHVVAFGGSRPLLAAPVFSAWLRRPLITLFRGNEFDAAIFSIRRRPTLDDAHTRSAMV
jgi:glycogen(starch) synthase